MGLADATVAHQAETLTFRIFKIEPEASVTLDHTLMGDSVRVKPILPPLQSALPMNPQGGVDDAVGAAPLALGREVEKCEVGAGGRNAVCVEQVIGAHVVLIDALLDETHSQSLRVEGVVARRIGRDGGEVVNSSQLHGAFPSC